LLFGIDGSHTYKCSERKMEKLLQIFIFNLTKNENKIAGKIDS